MKNLRHFTPQNNETEQTQTASNQYDRYMNMSESELLDALYKSIEQSKKNGTFDGEKLRGMVSLVKDKLSAEQLERLNKLLNKIK